LILGIFWNKLEKIKIKMKNLAKRLKLIRELDKIPEKARAIFRLPDLQDKIICFIPQWERSKFNLIRPENDDKDYLLNEFNLFSIAREDLLKNNVFSFVAYKKINDDYLDKDDFLKNEPEAQKMYEGMELLKKSLFKNKKERDYYDLSFKLEQLAGNEIHILPNEGDYKFFLKNENMLNQYKINILCIDYKYFPDGVLQHFLKYQKCIFRKKEELKIIRKEELAPLYRLFSDVSVDIKMESFVEISEIINDAYNKNSSLDNLDKAEYLSVNHIQNISQPAFWQKISKSGYLCDYNKNDSNMKLRDEHKDDFRLFYSFESLLFWELKNFLKKIKRCENCNKPLPKKINGKIFKGRYCPEGTECYQERNRSRQRAFQKRLKKF
jgi:hypothetical protein